MSLQEAQNEIEKPLSLPRRLPFVALLAASTISFIGDMLTLLAIPWFVLQTTGSVTQTGIAAFFSTLPQVLSAFFGSVMVDRLGYKRMSVVADLASVVCVALIPLLHFTIGLAFWQLLLLVFCSGLLMSPGSTARSALLPDLIDLAQISTERATAASDGIRRFANFVGAPLAGVLILWIGTSNLLWFDAASFLLSALLVGLFVPKGVSLPQKNTWKQYVTDLHEGLIYIRNDALLLALISTAMITNLLDGAVVSVIAPAYVKQVFGNALVLGLVFSVTGGAAFAGTLLFGLVGKNWPRRRTFVVAFIIGGSIRLFALALIPNVIVLLIVTGLVSLFIGPINPLIMTVFYERVPPQLRARVMGVVTAGVLCGIPLGTLISSYVGTWIGLRNTLLGIGGIYLITTLTLLINPAVKRMEKDWPSKAISGAEK